MQKEPLFNKNKHYIMKQENAKMTKATEPSTQASELRQEVA